MKSLLISTVLFLISVTAFCALEEAPDFRMTCEMTTQAVGLNNLEVGETKKAILRTLDDNNPEREIEAILKFEKISESIYNNTENIEFKLISVETDSEKFEKELSQFHYLLFQSARWSHIQLGSHHSYSSESCSVRFFENLSDDFPGNVSKEIGRLYKDSAFLRFHRNNEYPLMGLPLLLKELNED